MIIRVTEEGRVSRPIALTVAGSDSGGGAGIQADLKTFHALGVHGTSVIACITAQNPREVRSVQAIRPGMVRDQIEAIFAELPPQAAKTGMLYSGRIIREVAALFRGAGCALIVDPVMVATSGAVLLKPEAIESLKERLLPLATLVTPNLEEAEILVGRKLATLADIRKAAREIHGLHGCAALVKGGHLKKQRFAVDVLYDGTEELLLKAEFIRNVSTHGTGCTYSAAITAHLALGRTLVEAVGAAKEFITRAIAQSYLAGEHAVLDSGSE